MRLLDILFPRSCPSCRLDLKLREAGPLCMRCLRRLSPLPTPARDCGGLPVWGVYDYKSPMPELIHAFKYKGQVHVGRALGEWMAGFLPLLGIGPVDVLVPVPLHPTRLRERGFNQADVLADAVAARAKIRVERWLVRARKTEPQWRLGKDARAENIRGAFRIAETAAPPPESRAGTRVLLIDDVCTTGGTLENCAAALRAGGFKSVKAFVLALD